MYSKPGISNTILTETHPYQRNFKQMKISAKTIGKNGLILLMLFAMTTVACKKIKDPTEGAKLIVDYNLIQTSWSLKFIDAASGEIINNSEVEVRVNGQYKDYVCDITGVLHTDYIYHSKEGFFGCAVPYNVKPDPDNPVIFDLSFSCQGYIPTSVPVVATREDHFIMEIPLVNYNNLPNGVVMQRATAQTNNGILTENLQVTTAAIPTTGKSASLNIPAGTALKTGDGSLANGNVEATLILFSNMDDESLQAIPGGLIASVEGETNPKMFFSAGFVIIEMTDDSGNEIVTLEGGEATLEAGVADQTYNPDEGRTVMGGDEVSLWSYYAPNSERKYEDRTVTVNTKNGLMVSLNLNQLAWLGFDWVWNSICWEGVPLIFNSQDYGCDCIYMEAIVREELSGNNNILFTLPVYACLGEEYPMTFMPASLPVSIEFEAPCSPTHTAQQFYYFNDLCSQEIVYIELISGQNLSNVILDVSGYCPDEPDIIIRPTVGAWFRNINDWCWRWTFMTNGYANICDVQIGETYVVGIYYDGEWEEAEVHVTQEVYYYHQIELTYDICNNLNY